MAQSGGDKRIADLFTKGSHHRNLSVIYIVQNVFHQGKETRNISLNAHYIVLFKSPRDKQQISTLARQVSPGRVKEFMKSYEEATSRAHGYLMLDLKPNTDDNDRLKTNVLPGETNSDALQQQLVRYVQKQSYRQPPILNAMYNSKQKMHDIMQDDNLTQHKKSVLYSNEFNRFQAFQNQMQNQMPVTTSSQLQSNLQGQLQNLMPSQNPPQESQTPQQSDPTETYFLTPPPTVETPKLKRNFFHKWVSLADWHKRDVAIMTPDDKQDYEQHLLMTRSKYQPLTRENVEILSPEDRKEYHDTFKIKVPKSPKYNLRSRPY